MIMDGHFGLVAFCVANGWNVLGMVVFIYRMPFGSDFIRTDYDATSSVLSELHWWDIGCIVFNLLTLLVCSNQRDGNSAIFHSASPGTGPSKVRRQQQPAVDATRLSLVLYLSFLHSSQPVPPVLHLYIRDAGTKASPRC